MFTDQPIKSKQKKLKMSIKINSPHVQYTQDTIISSYEYEQTSVTRDHEGNFTATPKKVNYTFETKTKVPKFGLMLVGWGGNNGSTG